MVQFHETKMGHQFYGGTMPKIANALDVIAKKLGEEKPTEKEIRYKVLLTAVVNRISEENTIPEQVKILRNLGFSDQDLEEFGYSKVNLNGQEE